MSALKFPCQICSLAEFKYTCPKCNIQYCSVKCYKSEVHLKCSEEFYKSCVQEELKGKNPYGKNDVKKMHEILERMKTFGTDFDPADFDDLSAEPGDFDENATEPGDFDENGTMPGNFENNGKVPLDSDDDSGPEEEADLAERLNGVDIHNADEVWKRLTAEECEDFLNLTESGAIMDLIPKFTAWWDVKPNSKIVDISAKKAAKGIPEIMQNIPKYSSLCKKEPSPFLHCNLWNILSAYTAVVRYFDGEHQEYAFEAMAQIVNLSANLKYDTNFENANNAIYSVEVEDRTSLQQAASGATSIIENPAKLKEDARQIMSKLNFKLAALSDILNLIKKAEEKVKKATPQETALQKLFGVTTGCGILTKQRLKKYSKKFEFLLSYVNREHENL